jgi:dynein heavy chain
VYAFTFAVIWSLGASIDETHHEKMNDYVRDRFQSIIFPNVDLVYAYFLETSGGELSFKHWNDKIQNF